MIEPNTSESSQKGYFSKPENWVALLTLIAVGVYTAVQIWQTFLIRTNNVVSQRAFIFFDAPSVDFIVDPKTGTKAVKFGIPIINSGNTATEELEFLFRCAPSTDALPEPWVLLYRETPTRIPQLVGPHQTARAYCTFPFDQLNEIKDGKLHGYLIGDTTYRDRLDNTIVHRSQFSWELIDVNIIDPDQRILAILPDAAPKLVVSFQPRGRHNCADEECPHDQNQ